MKTSGRTGCRHWWPSTDFARLKMTSRRHLEHGGILAAHETAAGARLLHYYSDWDDQNGREAIETIARSAGTATRHVPDPSWTRVRLFS